MKNVLTGVALPMLIILVMTSCTGTSRISGERITDANQVQLALEDKSFRFVAESVLPMRGTRRMLNERYDLQIKGDTLVSDLPYFGRARTAPMNSAEVGIHFTSINYNYDVSPNGKNWDILIKPLDNNEVRQMNLLVFDNGKATLNVNQNSKDPISYSGYIMTIAR